MKESTQKALMTGAFAVMTAGAAVIATVLLAGGQGVQGLENFHGLQASFELLDALKDMQDSDDLTNATKDIDHQFLTIVTESLAVRAEILMDLVNNPETDPTKLSKAILSLAESAKNSFGSLCCAATLIVMAPVTSALVTFASYNTFKQEKESEQRLDEVIKREQILNEFERLI